MRLAILALSATAIAGCSWSGGAYHNTAAPGCYPAVTAGHAVRPTGYAQGYGYTQGYSQASACGAGYYGAPTTTGAFAAQGYGHQGYATQGYAAQGYAAPGHVTQGYTAQSYGSPAYASTSYAAQPAPTTVWQGQTTQGYGAATAMSSASATGYATGEIARAGASANATATTLGQAAPYGSAVTGVYGQTGSYVAPEVRTVMGEPIYVPQPYPVPLRGSACCGVRTGGGVAVQGGAMPFGIELFGGTEFDVGGDLFTKKSDGPPDGDFTQNIRVGEIDPISYADAFGSAKRIGAALTYDMSPNTTVLASVSHSKQDGQTVEGYTTVQPGTWAGGVFTPDVGSTARALDGTFTDLELTTVEAGVRHYVGHPAKLRSYIGATGGFVHNGDVQFFQTYSDDGTYYGERRFIENGWTPTASATLGAEMALGPRSAIGLESGIRWRDDMNSSAPSEDRFSVPLTLRGRLSF